VGGGIELRAGRVAADKKPKADPKQAPVARQSMVKILPWLVSLLEAGIFFVYFLLHQWIRLRQMMQLPHQE